MLTELTSKKVEKTKIRIVETAVGTKITCCESCISYIKLRKKYSRDFILEQKEFYFKFLDLTKETGFNQKPMMAERWLNPTNEYYLNDYSSEIKNLEKQLGKTGGKSNTEVKKTKVITEEDRMKAYEQNSR